MILIEKFIFPFVKVKKILNEVFEMIFFDEKLFFACFERVLCEEKYFFNGG